MLFHSLRWKMAIVFVLLILAVQTAMQIATSRALGEAARKQVDDQLTIGERIFRSTLKSEAERLAQAAAAVAADFGFREAVALRDQSTLRSALQNQRDRISADIALLVGLDSRLVASTSDAEVAGQRFPFPALMRGGAGRDEKILIGMLDGRLYELVSVPVKAPLTLAWVVMGFAVDDKLAMEMHGVTDLDVSFMMRDADGRARVLSSSLARPERDALQETDLDAALRQQEGRRSVQMNEGYVTRAVRLNDEPVAAVALLQKSFAEAAQPFHQLRSSLLLLTLGGIVISVIGAAVIARTVTRPLARLTDLAERIGRGDYAAVIDIHSQDETRELAAAFRQMRDGIVERESRITELAYMDPLTSLPNRLAFNEALQRLVDEARRAGQPFSMMLMDMDRFKYVNDELGHYAGDLLLCKVGRRLAGNLPRESGMVARLGGDEFAILLPNVDREAAQRSAVALLKALEAPLAIEGQTVDVSASFGIVCFPRDGADMHTLLRRADVAMYAAKRANAGMVFYDDSIELQNHDRLSLMTELRRAIENDELLLAYQPKVHLADDTMTHVEALLRWKHPERGMVPPGDFLPFAEQTGFIRSLSRWIVAEAVMQCMRWQAMQVDMSVSVNLSARDLIDPGLPDWIEAVLREHGVAPRRLWVEITESALMDEPEQALATLERLHACGIRISIDDFGTGYSSLSYLKRMPVDELKIDRSFITGMARDPDDEIIVRSTILLGHNMGLQVVAEGVEDQATLDRLRILGCDVAQGFYLGRPVPAGEIARWPAARGGASGNGPASKVLPFMPSATA